MSDLHHHDFAAAALADRRPSRHPRLHVPLAARVNAHADVVERASVDWAASRGLVAGAEGARRLAAARIGRLPALGFPSLPMDRLQLAADWTTAFCLLDDHTEDAARSPLRLATELARLLTSLEHGEPALHAPLHLAFADLGRRVRPLPAPLRARFLDEVQRLFSFFVLEGLQRDGELPPDTDTFRRMREVTVGLYPLFALGCMTPTNAEEAAALHPLQAAASRVVGLQNDLFTADKERAEGAFHNLVLLHERAGHPDAQGAVVAEHDAEVRRFLALAAPLRGANAGRDAAIEDCERWMAGHLAWATETARYRPPA